MRNRKKFGQADEMTDINISPLIDMVFILLIFFIVTTVFVEEEGMASSTPDPGAPNEPDQEQKERLTFTIKNNGEIFSNFGNVRKNVGLGGVRPLVQQEMQREKYAILINVERNSKVASYVAVHDTCLLAGATEGVVMKVVESE